MPSPSHLGPSGNGLPGQHASCVEVHRLVGEVDAERRAAAPQLERPRLLVARRLELARELAPQAEQPRVQLLRLPRCQPRALERRLVLRIGQLAGEAGEAANSRRRPSRVASAMTGSM